MSPPASTDPSREEAGSGDGDDDLLAALQPAQAQQVECLGNASVTGFVISIVMMILMCCCCGYMAYLECVLKKNKKEEAA